MKAVVYTEYGPPDVLRLVDVPTPVPVAGEVLIRVRATHVNFGDLLARNFPRVTPGMFNMPLILWLFARVAFGLRKPRRHILGNEFSGDVETVGSAVTLFAPGDQVYGFLGERMGTCCEYLCLSETDLLGRKPSNLTHDQAAAVPYGALMALSLLRRAGIAHGQRVLVNGASGSIGSAAVQLAKSLGARVTGVCSTQRMPFVRALGADAVIDYTADDFTRSRETWDLVVDVLGRGSFARSRRVLAPDGRYLCVSFKTKQLLQMLLTTIVGGQRVICALASGTADDLAFVTQLIERGKFVSVIDRCFPLAQAAEAHRYAESGDRRGHVVITV